MRIGRSLTVCRSLLPGGVSGLRGWCLLLRGVCSWGGLLPGGLSAPGGACLLRGGVCSQGVSALGVGGVCSGMSALGVCSRGCLLPGGVFSRGVSAPGGCLLPGGGIPACTWGRHPPVNRMTSRYKNITLATTSLRLVIIPPNYNLKYNSASFHYYYNSGTSFKF